MISTEKADWDKIFRALASKERRKILQTLFEGNGDMDVNEIAAAITDSAATNGGTDGAVAAYLHHTALPMLAEAGLVDWVSTDRTVSLNALAYRLPIGTVTPQLVPPQTAAPQQRADD